MRWNIWDESTFHTRDAATCRNHEPEYEVDIVKNILKDFGFSDPKMRIGVIGVRADVYDSVHVQVEIVEIR